LKNQDVLKHTALKYIFILFVCLAACVSVSGKCSTAGKRIAVLGDSMSWIGGDSCTNQRGWTTHFLSSAHPAAMDLYARSGATWTNTSATTGNTKEYSEVLTDENVIYTQMLRLRNRVGNDSTLTPDVIIVYAGANDAWFSSHRPGIFRITENIPSLTSKPSECTSLLESVRLVCRNLQHDFPDARVLLVTPAEMTKTQTAEVNRVGDLIERAGKECGVEVIRADRGVEIRSDDELKSLKNTYDGVHSSPTGARLISDFILSALRNNTLCNNSCRQTCNGESGESN